MAPPAATSGAVIARKASPAPTVSTTFLAKAGIVWTMPPRSKVTQPCLPWVMMILSQSTWRSPSRCAMSPMVEIRSLTASRASGASMQT